jgi:hypothetical protein
MMRSSDVHGAARWPETRRRPRDLGHGLSIDDGDTRRAIAVKIVVRDEDILTVARDGDGGWKDADGNARKK